MLGHAGTKTAERYTLSAWAIVDASAAAKVGRQLAGTLAKAKKPKQKSKVTSLRS
jgi:hypothetical protein